MYWSEYKANSENKNEYTYLLESSFVGVNTLIALVYSNQDNNSKRYKVKRYYLPKGIMKNYIIRKSTTGQGENYTT